MISNQNANSADQDQDGHPWSIWSGSGMFTKTPSYYSKWVIYTLHIRLYTINFIQHFEPMHEQMDIIAHRLPIKTCEYSKWSQIPSSPFWTNWGVRTVRLRHNCTDVQVCRLPTPSHSMIPPFHMFRLIKVYINLAMTNKLFNSSVCTLNNCPISTQA